MKTKTLSLFTIGALVLVLALNLVSAFTISVSDFTFTNSNTQSFTLTNTNTTDSLEITIPPTVTVTGEGSYSVTFNVVAAETTIPASGSTTITINPATTIDFDSFDLGKIYSSTFEIVNTVDSTEKATITVGVENSEYCEISDNGNLDISIDDINVLSGGFGDDEDYWYPGDEIEIDVVVENNADDDMENIEIEWVLMTADGEEVMDGDEKDFDLNDGDEETVTIAFTLDPKDLDDSTENYIFRVRATGEDTDLEEDTCQSDYQDIEIRIEKDFVVLTDIDFTSDLATCGSEIEITADVWNVGERDQDDVYVLVSNLELGLKNERIEIGNIDSFESESLNLRFTVPEDADEKIYTIEFRVYDEDDDIYVNDEDDDSYYTYRLTVEGGCGNPQPEVLVTAVLESGGRAGEEMVIKATVTNTGNDLVSLNLEASGYSSWASDATLDSDALVLASGASEDVLITLDVNKDAVGDKSFNMDVTSSGSLITSQPISVTIVGRSGFLTGGVIGITGDNWYLWAIGALNIILVIIIIVVAVRVARS